jgi:hypothetical protein
MNKAFPWIYRIVAIIFIFSAAFTIVFTAMYFTPGLSDRGDYCPSAFSNPLPKADDPVFKDLNTYATKSENELQETDAIVNQVKIEKDPVEKNILLSKFALIVVQQGEAKSQDARLWRLNEKLNELTCGFDSYNLDTKKLEKLTSESTKNLDATFHDKDITAALTPSGDQNFVLHNLTGRNVFILWLLTIFLGIAVFLLRRKVNPVQKLPKILRIVLSILLLGLLCVLTVSSLISEPVPSFETEKACKVTDGFDVFQPSHGQPFSGYLSIETLGKSLSRTDSQQIKIVEKAAKRKLSDEEKTRLIEGYDPLRTKAKKILSKVEATSDFQAYKSNKGIADGTCIAAARKQLYFAAFFVLFGIFMSAFIFYHPGRKIEN